MSVVVKSPLMAAHVWTVNLNYSAEVRDLLTEVVDGYRRPRKLGVRIRDADDVQRYPTMVLLSYEGDEKGITIGGLGPAWHMGTPGGPGPIIRDMEFISGNSFLDNPTFPADLALLHWKTSEDTGWEWNAASHDAGFGAAYVGTAPLKDDVLETREYPAEPGQEFFFFGWFIRGPGSLGRCILRTIYHGRFAPANLFPSIAGGAWDEQVSNNPQAAEPAFFIDGGVLKGRTPFPIYQLILNGSFVDLFDHWFTDLPPGGPGATQWVADGSAAPDLPTSVHYEGSGFITPDVVITNGSDVLTSATANWTSPNATGMLVEGPGIPAYSLVVSVSGPGTLQISSLATADYLAGDQSVAFRPNQSERTYLATDAENLATTLSQYAVVPNDRWTLSGNVLRTENANGTATIHFMKIKTATAEHLAGGFLEQAATFSTGGQLVLSTIPEGPVKGFQKDTTIEDETTHLGVFIELLGNTDGRWWFSNFRLHRFGGNKDWIEAAAPTPMTAERTYEFRVSCTPGPLLNKEAKARLLVHLNGPGREPITVTSSDQGPMKEGETATPVIVLDVTPPSGYTGGTAELMIEDTFNDVFSFGEMTVTDKDRSTVVFDEYTDHLQATWLLRQRVTTAPAGTETVSFAVVAEKDGLGWLADDFAAVRWNTPHATHTDVLEAILTNHDTAAPLPITLGSVVDPGVIPYDWHVLNLFNRDAFSHFNDVVASPWGEWYIDNADALHWAPAGSLFDDHHPDSATPVIFLPRDLDVVPGGISGVRSDVESRATHIEVIGADVPTGGGRSMLIKATSTVPGEPEYFGGELIQRWRQVIDGSIDHRLFAQAVADDEALREARPAISLTAKLNELDAATATALGITERHPFATGDTVYVYYPQATLRHEDYETEVAGETVWPRPVQVLEVDRSHADHGWRIEMVEPDGSTWDLPGVLWSSADETTLTLGDRLPIWKADPRGVAAGQQYLSDRKSRPR